MGKKNSEDTVLMAFYGTIKLGFGNNGVIYNAKKAYIGTGITKEKYAMYRHGIPFVIKEPKTPIVVDVFEVEASNLPRIDGLEGHPNWYRRELIPVLINGKELQCWLYFMTDDRVKNYKFVETGNYQ